MGYKMIEREGRNIVMKERGLKFERKLKDDFRNVKMEMVEGRSVKNDSVRIDEWRSFCKGFMIDMVEDKIEKERGYEIDMRMYENDKKIE